MIKLTGTKWYYVETNEKVWADAQSHCQSMGLELATMKTPTEHNDIINLVLDGGTYVDIWNPTLHQCNSAATCTNQFEDIAGNLIDTTFFNDDFNFDSTFDDCFEIRVDSSFYDEGCYNDKDVVCESNCGAMTPPASATCPPLAAMTLHGDRYLLSSGFPLRWTQAKTFCESYGLKLASIITSAEASNVDTFLGGTHSYVDAHNPNNVECEDTDCNGQFRTSDGLPIPTVFDGDTYLEPSSNELCLRFDDGELRAHDCSDPLNVVCESDCLDGVWSTWSDGPCSASCGAGTYTRTRTCDYPPQPGGRPCPGPNSEVQSCNAGLCKA